MEVPADTAAHGRQREGRAAGDFREHPHLGTRAGRRRSEDLELQRPQLLHHHRRERQLHFGLQGPRGQPITANTCPAPGPRGAANDENLTRQQDKIVAAINGLGADVVSLEEIENSAKFGKSRDAALSTLVGALNAALGSEQWAFVPSPAALPATEDVIRTAFIYKKAVAAPVGDSVILDDAAFRNARQPLAQAFAPVAFPDAKILAIVNHFKSKGDSDPKATGDNANGIQGAFNGDRVRQAEALGNFAKTRSAAVGTDDVFLLGDFNSYSQEDPIQKLRDFGFEPLEAGTGKYSYSFSGQSGSLDHVLASPSARELVTGADIWNINAVEALALEYSRYNYNALNFYDTTPYRSSDHDPVIVGLDLSPTTQVNLVGINDFHGRIDANTVRFAGTVEQVRAQYGEKNSLFISNGDNIGASVFASSYFGDKPTIDVLNALDSRPRPRGTTSSTRARTTSPVASTVSPTSRTWPRTSSRTASLCCRSTRSSRSTVCASASSEPSRSRPRRWSRPAASRGSNSASPSPR